MSRSTVVRNSVMSSSSRLKISSSGYFVFSMFRLISLPGRERLSYIITLWPFFSMCSARFVPRKPAPPVINIFMVFTSFQFLFFLDFWLW